MDLRKEELCFGKVTSIDGSKLTIKASMLFGVDNGSNIHAEIGSFVNCGGFHGDTIGTITRILLEEVERKDKIEEIKIVEVAIVGSASGVERRFTRGVESLPSISCECYLLNGEQVNYLLGVKLDDTEKLKYFKVGKRSMRGAGDAYFNLDKLLGRHTAIVGTTGSGKSSTVARLAQSILQSYSKPRLIFFDIHNEYQSAFSDSFESKANCIDWENFSLPYWFLDLDEFISIYYPEAGGTQTMYIKNIIEELKREGVDDNLKSKVSVDSPIFFDIESLINKIEERKNKETADGKKEPFNKMLVKIQSVNNDIRFSFLKEGMNSETSFVEYFKLLLGLEQQEKFITVLDLSGLPAEVRTICVGVLTRLCFDYKYWNLDPEHLPMALILEEAHAYIPETGDAKFSLCLERVEKVAKEGRKYGLSLIVVTQRPSNISSTVLSQCGTFITLRLTNDLDQNKIRRLLPDTLGDQADILSSLRDGEALVTGDAMSLPGKVQFDPPSPKPKSNDVRFHKFWSEGPPNEYNIKNITDSWIARNKKTRNIKNEN